MKKYQLYTLSSSETPEIGKYIGYTSIGLYKRLNQHVQESKTKTSKRACWIRGLFQKGEFPIINLLEDNVFDKQLAKDKEIQFIKIFKSCGAKLKNGTRGGDYIPENYIKAANKARLKPVTQYNLFGKKIKDFLSVNEAAQELKISPNAITKSIQGKQLTCRLYIFSYLGKEPKKIEEFRKTNRKILPISCTNTLTGETMWFNNQKEMAKHFNVPVIAVKEIINNNKLYKKIYKLSY